MGASVIPTSTKDCCQNQIPNAARDVIFPLQMFTNRAIQIYPMNLGFWSSLGFSSQVGRLTWKVHPPSPNSQGAISHSIGNQAFELHNFKQTDGHLPLKELGTSTNGTSAIGGFPWEKTSSKLTDVSCCFTNQEVVLEQTSQARLFGTKKLMLGIVIQI